MIDKYPKPISIEGTKNILNQMENSICKIYKEDGGKGTGFFCKIKYKNKIIPVFMTNNHVIDDIYLKKNKEINITLNDDEEEKIIRLNNDRLIYTNKMYDTTIIEIIPEKDLITNFMEIDERIYKDNSNIYYNKYSIYIIQYPKGEKAEVSYGIINKLHEYNISHYCCTETGSSGSPIINLVNNKIIGIHKEGSKRFNLNRGTYLKYPIFDFFNNFVIKKLNKINLNFILKENINLRQIDKSNPTAEGKALLQKDALKGHQILIVMLWSKTLNSNENQCIHKDYLSKVSPESKACLKDALDYLGINIDVVENYRDAIAKLIIKNENDKCPYYACWIINGPPIEDLPDGTREGFLFGQFLEVLKLFWEAGGALVFLAEGWKLQYQTNEFLKILDFDGKKIEFYLVGDDEEKGTKEHKGGKYLSRDSTGLLKNKQQFSNEKETYGIIQRLRLDHNLFTLFEGDTICYTSTDDYKKLLPFHPFSRDSDNGISSLFYLSDEKGRGDIFIDCGYTKLFINMDKDVGAFRYFQNIASWSARIETHLLYDNIDIKYWRPKGINYTIDINKKWNNFQKNLNKIDLMKLKTLFVFDNSAKINGNTTYFNEIFRIVNKYYKNGDKFYLWGDGFKEQTKPQISQWIINKNGTEGRHSVNIAKIANACPTHRDHLIIATVGKVDEYDIRESDKLMNQYNIKFLFVSVYMIGSDVDRSVGAPFCRGCQSRTIHVLDDTNRETLYSLSLDEINEFNRIQNINSISEFDSKYDKLFSAIKAKQIGKKEDKELKYKLTALRFRILNVLSESKRIDFERK